MKEIKVMLDKGAYMPERAHEADAGLDLKSPIKVRIPAYGSVVIDTGVHMAIPAGYFGKLESRSGLNVNRSIVSLGGVIDSGYTGSIVAKLYNFSDEDYIIYPGNKCIQIIIQPCATVELEKVEKLADTERGDNGFGSTGL